MMAMMEDKNGKVEDGNDYGKQPLDHNDDKAGQVPGLEEGAEQLPEGGRGVGQGRQ